MAGELDIGDEVYVRSLRWHGFARVVDVRRGDRVTVRPVGAGLVSEYTVRASACTRVERAASSNAITRPFNTKRVRGAAVPKDEPTRDAAYLRWLRRQPCCRCSLEGRTEASHHPAEGHGAMGAKCSDDRAIPLCTLCHRHHHQRGPLKRAWVEDQIRAHRARYAREQAA